MNFFKDKFRITFLSIILLELISFFCFSLNAFFDLSSIVFAIIFLGMAVLAIFRPDIALYIILGELFIGGKGHLLDLVLNGQSISIRIGLFCAFFLGFSVWLFRNAKWKELFARAFSNKSMLILGAICVWGIFTAWVNQVSFNGIFLDFNAWIFFLYFLPFGLIFKEKKHFDSVMQVFSAAVVWISIKTLFYFYAFTHSLPIIVDLYKWGRDTGWGEFTLVSGNLFRIFSQAQLFSMIGFCLFVVCLLFVKKIDWKKDWPLEVATILSASALIISLSRSFWVGAAFAAFIAGIFAFWKLRIKIKDAIIASVHFLLIIALAYGLVLAVFNFPIPWIERGSADLLSSRLSIEAAASSRQQQLMPLGKAIAAHPVLGSGWGTEVTYSSNDPRIKNDKNPTGEYTTAAFEWGYLDILLKIGLIGLIAYAAVVFSAGKNIFQKIINGTAEEKLIYIGLFCGLGALLATHMFSPYLNHPLGIGYILLLLVL